MPEISSNKNSSIIPEYSLTGDFLSFLRCSLQYRYHKKADWTSPNATQIWFGEFLHKMMAAGFHLYDTDRRIRLSALDWEKDLRPLEIEVYRQLASAGVKPTPDLFCPYDSSIAEERGCPDEQHPHKRISSERAEMAIKIIGEMIYPYIIEVERRLKGIREMPQFDENKDRSSVYGLTGIVDVISSINLREAGPYDRLILGLKEKKVIGVKNEEREFEIIIDYKGMKRPAKGKLIDESKEIYEKQDPEWKHHEWQIIEYAWLRKQQQEKKMPIKAGIIIYVNELVPSKDNFLSLKKEIQNDYTDVKPEIGSVDYELIMKYKRGEDIPRDLSSHFKGDRALRIIPFSDENELGALNSFDKTVREIEDYITLEIEGKLPQDVWKGTPIESNCTLCDYKTFCSYLEKNKEISSSVGIKPLVPPQI